MSDDDDQPLGTGVSEFTLQVGQDKLVVKCVNDFMSALVGGFVCPGSLRLAKFMLSEEFPSPSPPFAAIAPATTVKKQVELALHGRTLIDVGAGCGLLGIAAAKIQNTARVVMTDMPEVMEHLMANIKENNDVSGLDVAEASKLAPSSGFLTCMPLGWGNKDDAKALLEICKVAGDKGNGSGIDFLFAGDCFYHHDWVPLLLDTMRQVCSELTHAYVSGVPCPRPGRLSGSVIETLLLTAPQWFDLHLVSLTKLDPFEEEKTHTGSQETSCDSNNSVVSPKTCRVIALSQLLHSISPSKEAPTEAKDVDMAPQSPATNANTVTPVKEHNSTEAANVVQSLCSLTGLQPTHLCQGVWLWKRKRTPMEAPQVLPGAHLVLY